MPEHPPHVGLGRGSRRRDRPNRARSARRGLRAGRRRGHHSRGGKRDSQRDVTVLSLGLTATEPSGSKLARSSVSVPLTARIHSHAVPSRTVSRGFTLRQPGRWQQRGQLPLRAIRGRAASVRRTSVALPLRGTSSGACRAPQAAASRRRQQRAGRRPRTTSVCRVAPSWVPVGETAVAHRGPRSALSRGGSRPRRDIAALGVTFQTLPRQTARSVAP